MEKIKYNLKHEKIILGSMISNKDNRKKLIKLLSSSNFHGDRHKLIFSALQVMVEKNLDYTPATLISLLPQDEDWGGQEYLDKLEKNRSKSNIEYHINKLKWDKTRIELVEKFIPQLTVDLIEPSNEPETILHYIEKIKDNITNIKSTKDHFEERKTLAYKQSASILARQENDVFISSGYKILDKNLTEGFAKGKISVICGAPSNGKTSFSLNMARKQSKKRKVGILSWENGTEAALDSLISIGMNISIEKLIKYTNMIDEEEQKEVDDYLHNLLKNDNLSFLKPPPRQILQGTPWDVNNRVLDWVHTQLEDWNRDVVYWDLFLKKLPARTPDQVSNALDRAQEIASLENGVNTHLCLLHQINLKEVERQKDKRPSRNTLKGSGTWIEVPDLVLGVYRPAVYDYGIDDNIIEVICLKQRRGKWPWKAIFKWNGQRVKISGGQLGQMTYINEESNDNPYVNRI